MLYQWYKFSMMNAALHIILEWRLK